MKTLFSDLPSDSEAYAIYDHEYTLLEEPAAGTESMYDMLLYYGGPTHVSPNPVTSLADLHPGDAILTGLRKQSCYTGMVYQGNGKFLVGTGSNSNGILAPKIVGTALPLPAMQSSWPGCLGLLMLPDSLMSVMRVIWFCGLLESTRTSMLWPSAILPKAL
jgi:hypothetical protein